MQTPHEPQEVPAPERPGPGATPERIDVLVPPPGAPASGLGARGRAWLRAHRTEVLLFLVTGVIFSAFSGQRFLRQSEAPHFVYQAQAWLEGRLDVDPQVLPNLEDWACVREVDGTKVRCEGPRRETDTWFVSFPSFPAVVMLPFVALHGYQFNDTSFTAWMGALAVALFYSLLRLLRCRNETGREPGDDLLLALTLGFGSVLFYCAIRGEVWFTAQVMGVALSCLYLRFAVGARSPWLAGLFFSMATLTRTPLVFTGLFFLLEVLCPERGARLDQLKANLRAPREALGRLWRFGAGMAPLALLAAAYNTYRFGKPGEFGHSFLYNNRVNRDIDAFGLFDLGYLARNLDAALLKLPTLSDAPPLLGYDPHGLSILLTLPVVVLVLFPKVRRRLTLPMVLTVLATALPGLFYQNTGYMQFGFRFSLDYTPHLLVLVALGGWSFRALFVRALFGLGFLVNFWGALVFRGYTEWVRHW